MRVILAYFIGRQCFLFDLEVAVRIKIFRKTFEIKVLRADKLASYACQLYLFFIYCDLKSFQHLLTIRQMYFKNFTNFFFLKVWCVKLVYQNNLSFSELLDLNSSVAVHQKNLQVLVTEIYKVKNGIGPEIMKDIFELQNPSYNLRSSCCQFRKENIKTVHYGLQSLRYLGPKNWELVPNNIKYSNSLSKFKKLIKSRKPEVCPCKLYRTYIAQAGFM